MAYFANGAEGDYYEAKYCQRCIHFGDFGEACPILALHLDWNYEACNGDEADALPEAKAKHTALNTLWPCDGVHNGQCAMFWEKHNKGISEQSKVADGV